MAQHSAQFHPSVTYWAENSWAHGGVSGAAPFNCSVFSQYSWPLSLLGKKEAHTIFLVFDGQWANFYAIGKYEQLYKYSDRLVGNPTFSRRIVNQTSVAFFLAHYNFS